MTRRVVVTGLGIVSCLGTDAETVTQALYEGRSGISTRQEHIDMGLLEQSRQLRDVQETFAKRHGVKLYGEVERDGKTRLWIPFDPGVSPYELERNLYKSQSGNKLIFEEINRDLGLAFSYLWTTGDRFGFIR